MDKSAYAFALHNSVRQCNYYCVERLGQGGFGEVWGGFSDAGVPIAAKLWRPTSDRTRDISGWTNEHQLYLQCIMHPYIITSYDQFVSPAGDLVIVMERAEGSLEKLVESHGASNARYVMSAGIQICFALEHVHAINVIHRDVTARNVLWFPNGIVKLADFGISKALPTGEDFARTLIGLPGAIPPELLQAGRSTPQSDVYQLGLVLLQLLIGRAPIPVDTEQAMSLKMIEDGVPRQLAEAQMPLHGRLAEIIAMMLRRRTDWRYRSPAEVRTHLQEELNRVLGIDQMIAKLFAQQPRVSVPPIFRPKK